MLSGDQTEDRSVFLWGKSTKRCFFQRLVEERDANGERKAAYTHHLDCHAARDSSEHQCLSSPLQAASSTQHPTLSLETDCIRGKAENEKLCEKPPHSQKTALRIKRRDSGLVRPTFHKGPEPPPMPLVPRHLSLAGAHRGYAPMKPNRRVPLGIIAAVVDFP